MLRWPLCVLCRLVDHHHCVHLYVHHHFRFCMELVASNYRGHDLYELSVLKCYEWLGLFLCLLWQNCRVLLRTGVRSCSHSIRRIFCPTGGLPTAWAYVPAASDSIASADHAERHRLSGPASASVSLIDFCQLEPAGDGGSFNDFVSLLLKAHPVGSRNASYGDYACLTSSGCEHDRLPPLQHGHHDDCCLIY